MEIDHIDCKDVIDKFDDPEYLRKLIHQSATGNTAGMNQSQVATNILVAHTLRKAVSDLERALKEDLSAAIENHAKALNESANVAHEHARGLKVATWVLVFATVGLILVTGMQYIERLIGLFCR